MKTWLKQLFCRHEWVRIAVFQEIDGERNLRYGIRRYECRKCRRITHRDSRRDDLAAKSSTERT